MIPALYILLALVAVGIVLYVSHRLQDMRRKSAEGDVSSVTEVKSSQDTEEECCGMHITCEKDSLLASVSKEIEYYDDEELDVYAGRGADDYTMAEVEQFRDILLTLLPSDIAGWGRSLQLRGITLPADVRDELLLIVAEQRRVSNRL